MDLKSSCTPLPPFVLVLLLVLAIKYSPAKRERFLVLGEFILHSPFSITHFPFLPISTLRATHIPRLHY
jgi:hypothetical protein